MSRPWAVLVGALCALGIVFAPYTLSGALSERFDHDDAVELLRQANVDSCERTNGVRVVVGDMVEQSQANLEALRPELFNITRAEFDALVAQRREQADGWLRELRPVDCEEKFPAP